MPIQTDKQTQIVIESILSNSEQHRKKWDAIGGNSQYSDHRLVVLLREIGELSNSIYGKHEHPPELELIQIAGIAINWLRQFPEESIIKALEQTTREHELRKVGTNAYPD